MKTDNFHFPYLPRRFGQLGELAYNLWFSWHSDAIYLFRYIDQKLWTDVSNNPVRLLHEIDPQRLDELTKDHTFIKHYECVISAFNHYLNDQATWFPKTYPRLKKSLIAYFSMEFGIHECLPIYSGGLGILAGDHLKSASDMGIPMVGVGLLYRESYFTQFISPHGHQQSVYIHNDFSNMAMYPIRDNKGEHLVIRVKFDHRTIFARIWRAQIGRVPLFLLDTDFSGNPPEDRKITERLYIEDRDLRLIQEMLLGIGGITALYAMKISPKIFHMNEGHCAFLVMERIRRLIRRGVTIEEAVKKVRSTTVFTTHTPIQAGNETFEAERVDRFLKSYWESMEMSRDQFYGFAQPQNSLDPNAFNLTILSLHLSQYANGVSKLHGQVARRMWHHLWPDRPVEEVPIGYITNGIHTRTWMASQVKHLLDRHLGKQWRYQLINPDYWEKILNIPDEELWNIHNELKTLLINEVRQWQVQARERNGESRESIDGAARILNPGALTIGFARRFTPYKRATLLLQDIERLKRILMRNDLPVQIIFAGKAHPADQTGKGLIMWIYGESRNPDFGGRIIYVENYAMSMAKRFISGVDVWLNTPRRPLEACGTSGMKSAVNGVLNLSIMDGWWQEGYNGKNGWAIGENRDYYNDMEQDQADIQSLYNLLENEVIPLFYNRDEKGIPRQWIQKMKESMRSIIPQFNTNRMVTEYMTKMYIPAMKQIKKPSAKT